MTRCVKIGFVLLLVNAFVASGGAAYSRDDRDFPLPESKINDFADVLSPEDFTSIMVALDRTSSSNGMQGYVIIAASTDEWNFDEYLKDYADFLQGKGLLDSTSWLIYVSVQDRKYGFAVQDSAAQSITPRFKEEMSLIMGESLENGDVTGAVTSVIDAVGKLPKPENASDLKNMSPDLLVFAGIALMVVVMMIRIRKTKARPSNA